jgi:hypothetical protein
MVKYFLLNNNTNLKQLLVRAIGIRTDPDDRFNCEDESTFFPHTLDGSEKPAMKRRQVRGMRA